MDHIHRRGCALRKTTLDELVDWSSLTLRTEALTTRQRELAHLIDPRFFADGTNLFRAGKVPSDYHYETPLALEEDAFLLHALMDPSVLELGAVRRFPPAVNEKYLVEKFLDDRWVSDGNDRLSQRLEDHLRQHLEHYRAAETIRLLDIGPCGGAITTLFALRAFDRTGLLSKTVTGLLDVVPSVLEATRKGAFVIPEAMINSFDLAHAGSDGSVYKRRLASAKKTSYYLGSGAELLAKLIGQFDVVLAGYVHHHMNLHGRRALCQQMEAAVRPGAFIGVVDFCAPDHRSYMEWYRPHFQQTGDAPPVECPLVTGERLATWFSRSDVGDVDTKIPRSFVLSAVKR